MKIKLLLNIGFKIKESMVFLFTGNRNIYLKVKGIGSKTKFLNITFNIIFVTIKI